MGNSHLAQFTPQNLFFGPSSAQNCSKCLSSNCVCHDTLRLDPQAMKEKFQIDQQRSTSAQQLSKFQQPTQN